MATSRYRDAGGPMPQVVLHIGAFKSGTTFIQHTLGENRGPLADDGVLAPTDETGSRFRLFRDFWTHVTAGDEVLNHPLSVQSRGWHGSHVVISAERMSLLDDDLVATVVGAFEPHPVRVVYGARDLARTVPSQWQSSVRGWSGARFSYSTYVASLAAGPESGDAARSFWQRHDWADIIERWGRHVGEGNVALMPVPQQRAGEGALWSQFATAAGIDPTDRPVTRRANASLGVQSAETVRQLSLRLTEDMVGESITDSATVGRALRLLARNILSQRRSVESTLTLPSEYASWAEDVTDAMLARLTALSPTVVGNLEDLRPHLPDVAHQAGPAHPDLCTALDLLQPARFALTQLAPATSFPDDGDLSESDAARELDRAIDAIAAILRRRTARRRA